MNSLLWQVIAESCGIYPLKKTTFFKTEFIEEPTIQDLLFLGHVAHSNLCFHQRQ